MAYRPPGRFGIVSSDRSNQPSSTSNHRSAPTGSSSSGRPMETGSSSGNQQVQTGSSSSNRPVQTGSSSSNWSVQTGASSGNRPLQSGSSSSNRRRRRRTSSLYRTQPGQTASSGPHTSQPAVVPSGSGGSHGAQHHESPSTRPDLSLFGPPDTSTPNRRAKRHQGTAVSQENTSLNQQGTTNNQENAPSNQQNTDINRQGTTEASGSSSHGRNPSDQVIRPGVPIRDLTNRASRRQAQRASLSASGSVNITRDDRSNISNQTAPTSADRDLDLDLEISERRPASPHEFGSLPPGAALYDGSFHHAESEYAYSFDPYNPQYHPRPAQLDLPVNRFVGSNGLMPEHGFTGASRALEAERPTARETAASLAGSPLPGSPTSSDNTLVASEPSQASSRTVTPRLLHSPPASQASSQTMTPGPDHSPPTSSHQPHTPGNSAARVEANTSRRRVALREVANTSRRRVPLPVAVPNVGRPRAHTSAPQTTTAQTGGAPRTTTAPLIVSSTAQTGGPPQTTAGPLIVSSTVQTGGAPRTGGAPQTPGSLRPSTSVFTPTGPVVPVNDENVPPARPHRPLSMSTSLMPRLGTLSDGLDDGLFTIRPDRPSPYLPAYPLLLPPSLPRPAAPPQAGRPVRATSVWFDPFRLPLPPMQVTSVDAMVNIYRLQDDNGRVWEYVRPSERFDGGIAALAEMDWWGRRLWCPAYTAPMVLSQARTAGSLRRIIDEGRRGLVGGGSNGGYVYYVVRDHRYNVAWACALQGWRILGLGVGVDRGNLFMETFEGVFR